MAVDGVDYSWGRPDPYELAALGYQFACRYVSYDNTGKNLSPDELAALSDAGIAVVLNWEYEPEAPLNGYQWGIGDAVEALDQANALGCPADCPIYFSVDFNATPDQFSAIGDYFAGVQTVIGADRTGIYGSFDVIDAALDNDWASWFWQTYAWSNGLIHRANHIYQYRNGVQVAGDEVDLNQAHQADIGAWGLFGPEPETDLAADVWAYPVAADDESLTAGLALVESYVSATTAMPDQLDAVKAQLDTIEHKVNVALLALKDQIPPDANRPDPCVERVTTAFRSWLERQLAPVVPGRHRREAEKR